MLSIICILIILFISPAITAYAVSIEHDCSRYITSKQDDNYHWQECSLCGSIQGGKQPHVMNDNGWTYDSADICYDANLHSLSCSCGFSVVTAEGRKEHDMSGRANETDTDRGIVYEYCVNAGCSHFHKFSFNENGQVDTSDWTETYHRHTDAYGRFINPYNYGTCIYCGQYIGFDNYNNRICHYYTDCRERWGDNGFISYCACGVEQFREIHYPVEYLADGYVHTRFDIKLAPIYGTNITGTYSFYMPPASYYLTSSSTYSYIGNGWYRIDTYNRFNKYDGHNWLDNTVQIFNYIYADDFDFCDAGIEYFTPEITPPAVSGVNQRDVYTTGSWCTAKELTIYGTENWCKTVNFNLRDADGNYYVINAQAPVTDAETGGSWSFSYIPDIEADENEKQFVFEVWDSFYNKTEYPFTVYKTDKKPPVGITESTGQEWSKTKTVTLTATDAGSRDVWFGIDSQDYVYQGVRNGNTFTYDYVVGGDVYGGKVLTIYTKDGADNESGHEVIYYNLDNTAPTITNVTKAVSDYNMNLAVSAHDANASLGLSGSGVTGYAVTSQATAPDLSAFQGSNVLTVSENGTYYLWARDLVGNISSCAIVSVTELMTSYKAEHYLQNLDGTYGTPADTNVYEDIRIGTSVTPAVKSYTGFNTPETQTVTVEPGSATVVKYYYTRKSYTLSLYKTTGIESVSGAGTYLYGQSVTVDAAAGRGWTFKEWTGTYITTTKNYTFTIPSSDVSLTANAYDITGPEVLTAIHLPYPEWVNTDVVITVHAEDWGVGLADEPYSYDKGVTWTSDKTITVPVNGTYPIWARDKNGNISKLDYEVSNIDKVPPVITGLANFYDLDYIDRETNNPVYVDVYVTDDASGVASASLTVLNYDSNESHTWAADGDGIIKVNVTEGDLFFGNFIVTVNAVDVASNTAQDHFDTTEFLLESRVTRVLGEPHDTFKAGESGTVYFNAWGYVDDVYVTFPSEFQTNYTYDAHYEYVEKVIVQTGSVQFMVPLKAPERGDYEILVEAWKDGHKLTQHLHLSVVRGTVLDELRTRLKNH